MKDPTNDRRRILLAGLGGLAAQLGVPGAAAQDPVRVMPRTYRVVLENEKVRVLEFISRPGMVICGEGIHSHPARLTIVMNGYQARSSTANAPAKTRQRKDGEVFWSEAVTHKVENVGKTESRTLIVELKTPGKPKG